MTVERTRERRARRITRLAHDVADHRRWLDQHGGSLGGYVRRYGSVKDLIHDGDGGEAIYAADLAALRAAEERLAAARASQ